MDFANLLMKIVSIIILIIPACFAHRDIFAKLHAKSLFVEIDNTLQLEIVLMLVLSVNHLTPSSVIVLHALLSISCKVMELACKVSPVKPALQQTLLAPMVIT